MGSLHITMCSPLINVCPLRNNMYVYLTHLFPRHLSLRLATPHDSGLLGGLGTWGLLPEGVTGAKDCHKHPEPLYPPLSLTLG